MKHLIIETDDGYTRASTEDLVSSKMNVFTGWHCEAGKQSLYIDYDHKVWISNCASLPSNHQKLNRKDWGYLGTIDDQFPIPTAGVTCPIDYCGCGSDIALKKWRKETPIKVTKINYSDFKDVTKINNVRTYNGISKQILWDLSRRCNYSCSYCWDGVHNKTDEHLSLARLKQTADYVTDNWSEGNPIRWYFGGGEPTLNPDFEPFVEYLSAKDHWIMLVTNASQGPKYWETNAKNYDVLVFSIHFEYMKEHLLIENAKRVMETLFLAKAGKLKSFIIKLMTKPGELDKSEEFAERLKREIGYYNLPEDLQSVIMFDFVPLRDLDDGSVLRSDYTKEEQIRFVRMNERDD